MEKRYYSLPASDAAVSCDTITTSEPNESDMAFSLDIHEDDPAEIDISWPFVDSKQQALQQQQQQQSKQLLHEHSALTERLLHLTACPTIGLETDSERQAIQSRIEALNCLLRMEVLRFEAKVDHQRASVLELETAKRIQADQEGSERRFEALLVICILMSLSVLLYQ